MAKPRMPNGLKARGKELWRGLVIDDMPTDQMALLVEACRTVDLLDEINRAINGKPFVDLLYLEVESDEEVALKIDSLLMEQRQQQQNLKQLLVTLRQLAPGAAKPQGRGSRGAYGKRTGESGGSSLAVVEGGTGGGGRGWRAG